VRIRSEIQTENQTSGLRGLGIIRGGVTLRRVASGIRDVTVEGKVAE
jgi:hypothetical protein